MRPIERDVDSTRLMGRSIKSVENHIATSEKGMERGMVAENDTKIYAISQ